MNSLQSKQIRINTYKYFFVKKQKKPFLIGRIIRHFPAVKQKRTRNEKNTLIALYYKLNC